MYICIFIIYFSKKNILNLHIFISLLMTWILYFSYIFYTYFKIYIYNNITLTLNFNLLNIFKISKSKI